jgi:hypothetical protein
VGTWDTKTFDNDDAMDWAAELGEADDLSVCERSLNPEELRGYYLQASDCVGILCAAEVLAALRGRPSPDLPEEVQQWVGAHRRRLDVTRLLPIAITKIDRVLAVHSELDELWKENETDYPSWRAGVDDLRSRLAG